MNIRRTLIASLAALPVAAGVGAPSASAHPTRTDTVYWATQKGNRVAANASGYNDRPRYAYAGGTDWISDHDDYYHERRAARKYDKRIYTRTGSYVSTCSYTINVPWWTVGAFDPIGAMTVVWRSDAVAC
jgi:hypothetical protein